jgi:hypothetical protein
MGMVLSGRAIDGTLSESTKAQRNAPERVTGLCSILFKNGIVSSSQNTSGKLSWSTGYWHLDLLT